MIEYRTELFSVLVDLNNLGQWGQLLSNSFCMRKRVFIDHFGWSHPSVNGPFEYDEFDNLGTAKYLIITRDGVHPIAMVRLIPTSKPNMLQTIQHRISGYACPKRDDVWEMSRLALQTDLSLTDRIEATKALERSLEKFSLGYSVESFVAWVSTDTMRLLKAAGYKLTQHATLLDDEQNDTAIVEMRSTETNFTDEFRAALRDDKDEEPMSNLIERDKSA